MNTAEGFSAPRRGLEHVDNAEGDVALRRRKHAQTSFSEDTASPLPSIGRQGSSFRRANSFRTESSVGGGSRRSMQSSSDSIFSPRPTDEHEDHETTWRHSTPLLFAILPAIGGVIFKRGSVLLTDLALLALAALYLNWCLVTPWIWYHSAQTIKVADFPSEETSLGVVDEVLADGVASEPQDPPETNGKKRPVTSPDTSKQSAGLKELRMHELTALALCFIGPLLGSYILHIIRLQLSTLGDQLVSNLHLTLFILGAEIRPMRYAMKMAQARTVYLQRLVREDPHAQAESQFDNVTIQDMSKRLNELEASFADKVASNDLQTSKNTSVNEEVTKKLQSSLQTQIDALNRAVRRYEKRATAQTMQTESRLQDLDTRLKEAVSLAAAVANYSQKPGFLALALSTLRSVVLLPLGAAWAAMIYPFQVARGLVLGVALRLGLVTTIKSSRKSTATQSKSGSDLRKSRKPARVED